MAILMGTGGSSPERTMEIQPMRSTTGVLVIALLAALVATGCETIQQNPSTAIGTGAGPLGAL